MSRRVKFGCAVALVPLILLCSIAAWLEITLQSPFLFVDRDSSFSVSWSFGFALMQNRSDIAKELLDQAQWQRLDDWMAEHKPIKCIQSGIPDEGSLQIVGPYRREEQGGAISEVPFLYMSVVCVGFDYDFTILDIRMRSTPDGWLIEDWGEITEGVSNR